MNEKTEGQRLVIRIGSQEQFNLLIKRLIEAVRTLTGDNHSYQAIVVLDAVLMLLEGKKE